jgi:hypothetical protein
VILLGQTFILHKSDTTFLIGTDLLRLHPVDLVIFTKTEEEGTKEREVPSVEMKFQLSPIVVATGPPEQPLKEEGSTPKQPARDEKQAQREAPSGKVEDITPDVTTTTTEPTATWKNKFTTSLRGPTTPATPSTPTTIQRLVQTQSQNKPEKEKATTASLVGNSPKGFDDSHWKELRCSWQDLIPNNPFRQSKLFLFSMGRLPFV